MDEKVNQDFKSASDSEEIKNEQKHFQEMFPGLVIEEEEENEIMKFGNEISSPSQSFSSSSSEEEKKVSTEDNKPRYRKSKVRKSILKSNFLTNKRQTRGSHFDSKARYPKSSTLDLNGKQMPEGRLPIRRPSNAEAMMQASPFNK